MALHGVRLECWSGVKLQWMTYRVCSRSSSLRVVPPPTVLFPRLHEGLLA